MNPSLKLMKQCERESRNALLWLNFMKEEAETSEILNVLESQWEMNRRFYDRLHQEKKKDFSVQKTEIFLKLRFGLLFRHTDREMASLLFDACFERIKRMSHTMNHIRCREKIIVLMAEDFIEIQQDCIRQL